MGKHNEWKRFVLLHSWSINNDDDIGHGDHDGFNDGGDEGDVHGGIDDDADYLATLTG